VWIGILQESHFPRGDSQNEKGRDRVWGEEQSKVLEEMREKRREGGELPISDIECCPLA